MSNGIVQSGDLRVCRTGNNYCVDSYDGETWSRVALIDTRNSRVMLADTEEYVTYSAAVTKGVLWSKIANALVESGCINSDDKRHWRQKAAETHTHSMARKAHIKAEAKRLGCYSMFYEGQWVLGDWNGPLSESQIKELERGASKKAA